eukprot:gene4875-6831_t
MLFNRILNNSISFLLAFYAIGAQCFFSVPIKRITINTNPYQKQGISSSFRDDFAITNGPIRTNSNVNNGLIIDPSMIKLNTKEEVVVRHIGSPRVIPPSADSATEEWMMWYHIRDNLISSNVVELSTGRILFATSKDGISNWKVHPDSPILNPGKENGDWFLYDSEHVGLGDVIQPGISAQSKFAIQGNSMYLMYTFGGNSMKYHGDSSSAKVGDKIEIGVAVSQDGAHWSRIEGPSAYGSILEVGNRNSNDFDSAFIGWPNVVETDSREYRMYYHTYNMISNKFEVAYADSPDGVMKWKKRGSIFSGSNNINDFDSKGVTRRHVLKLNNNKYMMYYEGIAMNGMKSVGLATSNDGITWVRDPSNKPVFTASSEESAWDSHGVGSPHLVWLPYKRKWRMYYVGYNNNNINNNNESISSNSIINNVLNEDQYYNNAIGVAESTDESGTSFIRI